jgi:hypothetical protein
MFWLLACDEINNLNLEIGCSHVLSVNSHTYT